MYAVSVNLKTVTARSCRYRLFSSFLFLLRSRSGAHASPRTGSISSSLGTKVQISITSYAISFSLRVHFKDNRKG